MNKIEFDTQICTTIEQSKRLLELGLKPETADCYYSYEVEEHGENRFWEIIVSDWEPYWEITNNTIPAWSLHRLMEIGNITGVGFLEIDNIYEVCIRIVASRIRFKLINPEYINN